MKLNPDDPRLTAYALDELGSDDRISIEDALKDDAEAQQAVAEIRFVSGLLKRGFAEEKVPGLTEKQRSAIHAGRVAPLKATSARPFSRWIISGSLAASFALFVVVTVRNSLYDSATPSGSFEMSASEARNFKVGESKKLTTDFSKQYRASELQELQRDLQHEALAPVPIEAKNSPVIDSLTRSFEAEALEAAAALSSMEPGEGFTLTRHQQLNTVTLPIEEQEVAPLDLFARLGDKKRPEPDNRRIGKLLHYFTAPIVAEQEPSLRVEVNEAPWAPSNQLLHIESALGDAKEGSLVVEFNSEKVHSHRFLNDISSDAWEYSLPSPQATALFELVPTSEAPDLPEVHWATVRLNVDPPAEAIALGPVAPADEASTAFQLSSAISHFGLLLKDPAQAPGESFQGLLNEIPALAPELPRLQEFTELVRRAEAAFEAPPEE